MKLTLEIDGIVRVFQGSYDEMRDRDWNVRVVDLIDSAQEYEAKPRLDMPGFEGTWEALDKLKIR